MSLGFFDLGLCTWCFVLGALDLDSLLIYANEQQKQSTKH